MKRQASWALLLSFLIFVGAQAGEYYLSDDAEYWWYWDDGPNYELFVPAQADSYAPRHIFAERSLEIALKKQTVVMRISSVAKVRGGWSGAKQSALERWQHVLGNVKITEDKQITTSRGVKAHFLVATGQTTAGNTGMIRLVTYFKGDDAVSLQLWCEQKDYSGDVQRYWIKAVNTFNWR